MLVIAENDGNLPQEFEFLETIKNENLTFGFDSKTGLGKLYDSRTDTVWSQYYASPTVGTEIIPLRFDDTSAWTITSGTVELGGENEVVFLLDWMEEDGKVTSVFPGEKICEGNYKLVIEYETEAAKGFDLSADVILWRNNINPENNGDLWLSTAVGEKKSCKDGVKDGKYKYEVDVPQSIFKDYTGSFSIEIKVNYYENATGKVKIKSAKLIGQSGSANPVTVSSVKKNGNEINLKVNTASRKEKNLSAVDCSIGFENGALKYTLTADENSSFDEVIQYPPTFYNDSDDLKWMMPKDSGLLLSSTDLESYVNKRLKTTEFYQAGGLDMAFFGAVDNKANSGYFAVVDTPINAGVSYPQSQLGQKQGYLPTIYFFGDKEKWKEDRNVRFFFKDSGDYVDIAKAYREIAKEKGFVKTYEEKAKDNPMALQTVYAHRVDLAIDVRAIMNYYDKLAEAGISNVMTRLADVRDTAKDGVYVDLQSLIDTDIFVKIKERYPDAMFYEYLNPRDIYLEAGEYDLDEDYAAFAEPYLLVGKTGKNFSGWTDVFGVSAYIACTEFYSKYMEYRMKRYPLSSYPTTIKFIDILGTCSFGEGVCYSKEHPSDRTELYNAKINMLKMVSDLDCDPHTEGAAEYMVPYANSFEGSLGFMNIQGMYQHTMDMMDSGHGIAKDTERIPLWQLVFHDCAGTYWHWEFGSLELQDRNKYCDLFSLLYGERGMFMPGYSSTYPGTSYFNTMLERIKKLNTVLLQVGTDEMIDHEFLTDDGSVQKTTFSSGVSVIVNFSETETFKDGDTTVDPWGYSILNGKDLSVEEEGNVKVETKIEKRFMPMWGIISALCGLIFGLGFVAVTLIIYKRKRN